MKRILLIVSLMTAFATAVKAQEGEIRGVISDQITAFQANDFETAFGFASATIKRLFGTPENFGRMVREGYPMVYRPADVRFLQLEDRRGGKSQRVMLRDASGAMHVLE
jgi:hypothetical protein